MLAKHFSIIRNYVLSAFLKSKSAFCHENTLLETVQTNSSNINGRNPSMAIPFLANQDFALMLTWTRPFTAASRFSFRAVAAMSTKLRFRCVALPAAVFHSCSTKN